MNYEFIHSPIILKRIDRRTPNQKKWAKEKANRSRNLKREIHSVTDLISMGFYEDCDRTKPYGIEVWERKCTIRNRFTNFEWEEKKIPTLSLSLSENKNLQSIKKFAPMHWDESDTYYWAFNQRKIVALWCICDLLGRLLYLPHWESSLTIPLRWRFGNEKTFGKVSEIIHNINETGKFDLNPPHIKWMGDLNTTRHRATPYDYEWQTGKLERGFSRNYWNQKILS
jgi:hypothetical protein